MSDAKKDMSDDSACWVDSFCRPDPNIPYLQKIITNPDPDCYGLWERIVLYELGEYAHNFLTRNLRYAVLEYTEPLLYIRFFFFAMIGMEFGLQTIIKKQLERAGDTKRLEFFQTVFIPFARSSQQTLIAQPFDRKNSKRLILLFVALLQFAWKTQTTVGWSMQDEYIAAAKKEAAYIVANNRANKQLAKEKLRMAPKENKKPRRRGGLNSHRLAPAEETNAPMPLP